MNFSTRSSQQGFNLLEILIALALGAFVLAGVIQIYLSNQYSSRYQQAVMQLQEQGRFALDLIVRNLRMAGYDDPDPATLELPEAFTDLTAGEKSKLSPPTLNGAKLDGDRVLNNDVLVTFFEGGSGIYDCLGNDLVETSTTPPTLLTVRNVFKIQNNELVCEVDHSDGNSIVFESQQPLAFGIEFMRVRYGEDTDDDGTVNRYVPENDVDAWDKVLSVQVAIIANSVTEVLPEAGNDCLSSCTVFENDDLPDTRALRAEFTTTVRLRNDP